MAFEARDDFLSWGRVLRERHHVAAPHWPDELPGLLTAAQSRSLKVLPAGLRRSYGDSGLNPDGGIIDMTGIDRLIVFDPATRVLRAGGGVSFDRLLKTFVPRGFFLPVTPGTRFVTLGGAIANDVHGKNHHGAGTIGRWVRRLGLMRSDGGLAEIAPGDALFGATIGGLGLTGLIVWAEIELIPIATSMMDVETIPFGSLDDYFAIAAESDSQYDYTVSWVDCLATGPDAGRGTFTRARHAASGPLTLGREGGPAFPVDLPGFALNNLSIKAFNALYAWNGRRQAGKSQQHLQGYFYPLDAIGHWNRMYGRRGMYQYQSVVPPEAEPGATKAMLAAIASAGEGSFLAVLKGFGPLASPGFLSFPKAGTTLALDFPNRGETTLRLMARLDDIVREAGGRLYPAKDGRISREMFRAGYPGWETFADHVDPQFSSRFWRRVGL